MKSYSHWFLSPTFTFISLLVSIGRSGGLQFTIYNTHKSYLYSGILHMAVSCTPNIYVLMVKAGKSNLKLICSDQTYC